MAPNLSLVALDGIERAALALVAAVQHARGSSSSSSSCPLSPSPVPGSSVVEVCNQFLEALSLIHI